MKQGILMIACGHAYYGKMAAALAASIKVREDFPICLLHSGKALSHLNPEELALFDITEQLDEKYYLNADGTFNPLKARMHIYKLSPFAETLSIDVDNVWLQKKPSEVFSELKEIDFTIQNSGYTLCNENADKKMSVWADINEVIESYNLNGKKFYQTFGEWIYFKKSAAAKKLFTSALKIFNTTPKIKVASFIGQQIPDELAFSIAMAQTEIYPHIDKYLPTTYYDVTSLGKMRNAHIYELAKKYIAISLGSTLNPRNIVSAYNTLVIVAYKKLGLKNPYKWKNKTAFLTERIN